MADEKLFEGQLKNWMHSIGIYPAGFGEDRMILPMIGWYTKIWGGGYQKSGIPDILCCILGQFVAIEVKAQNGRPSPLQKLNIQRIRDSGGHGVFLYPSGFKQFQEDVKEMVNELQYSSFCYRLQEVYK